MTNYNCITVLGPTASGKTHLACQLAYHLQGEIISADSRQVYQLLNIGTGKDLEEYVIHGKPIPYHLIDLVPPTEQFYLHQFMEGLEHAFYDSISRQHLPIICGGTGLYLDALHKDFSLTQVKENEALRLELEALSKEALQARLDSYPRELTQQVDRNSAKRLVRGIEIAEYCQENQVVPGKKELPYRPYYIGMAQDIHERKQRIHQRLKRRLEAGLVEEVEGLLKMGITPERLELFGLEYKFVMQYLQSKISKDQLFSSLQTAIFQFAKRQMTWFRKMEKEGIRIHWIAATENPEGLIKKLRTEFQPGGPS